MSEVSGPTSSMPGSSHNLPDGATCDEHPDRPAVRRIQGETDSFGAEYYDLCAECLEQHRNRPPPAGDCDWCKKESEKLTPRRDSDEGSHGRVYLVCDPCIQRDIERLRAEREEFDDYY